MLNYAKTKNVTFVELPKRIVKENSSPHNAARESVGKDFTLRCHPITLSDRNKCYIYPEDPHCGFGSEWAMFHVPRNTNPNTYYAVVNPSEEDSPIESFGLLAAGNRYFTLKDFDYKSKEQMAFTTMVLLRDN